MSLQQKTDSDLRTSQRVQVQAQLLTAMLIEEGKSTDDRTSGFPREFSASGVGKGGGVGGAAIEP